MTSFNFRNVLHECGIHGDNETNWAVGHVLREVAARRGIEPQRLLCEKTDPNPTVAAPHCIAHYPAELFQECCDAVRRWWGDRTRQLPLL